MSTWGGRCVCEYMGWEGGVSTPVGQPQHS